MKTETLNGTLTVECKTITATVTQSLTGKGFHLEISRPDNDEVLDTEELPSIRKVYERIGTLETFYRENGF